MTRSRLLGVLVVAGMAAVACRGGAGETQSQAKLATSTEGNFQSNILGPELVLDPTSTTTGLDRATPTSITLATTTTAPTTTIAPTTTTTASPTTTIAPTTTSPSTTSTPTTTAAPPVGTSSTTASPPPAPSPPLPPVVEEPGDAVAPTAPLTVLVGTAGILRPGLPTGPVSFEGLPPGAAARGDGTLAFQPERAGTWPVVATGAAGDTTRFELRARYPAHPGSVLGLGDSVAAGHGLDVLDYLGGDSCFRAENDAYPRLVYDALRAAGRLPGTPAFALVACSGFDAADLDERAVGGGIGGTAPAGSKLSQVEWTVRANPGLAIITIGANDTGFTRPDRLLLPDGTLDQASLDTRLSGLSSALDHALARLISETDATIVLTTYHNPVADSPHGVAGCETTCFKTAVDAAVAQLNTTIAEVGSGHGDRVIMADVSDRFLGHGAANGLGPDDARAGEFGQLGELIAALVGGTHPYCAKGHHDVDNWVNIVDCVHPNAAGTAAYAAVVLDVLANTPVGI